MSRHIKSKHGNQSFACGECGKVYQQKHHLKAHISAKHENTPFLHVCVAWSTSFVSRSSLKEHQRLYHEDKPRYRCTLCPKVFMVNSHFMSHTNKHYNFASYKYNIYAKIFQHQCSLTTHKGVCAGVAPPAPRHVCPTCDKVFKLKCYLDQHIRRKHTQDNDANRCDKCGKTFGWKATLNRHRKTCVSSANWTTT